MKFIAYMSILLAAFHSIAEPELNKDKDPKVASEVSTAHLLMKKAAWSVLTAFDTRKSSKLLYSNKTKTHFNVGDEKLIALTIDDGFNSQKKDGIDCINEVSDNLNKHHAKATFFLAGDHLDNVPPEKLRSLIDNNHELANHNWQDRNYHKDSLMDFFQGIKATDKRIKKMSGNPSAMFYRAPCGKINEEQLAWLDNNNKIHVLGDVFAWDTAIPDSNWIADYITRQSKPGSIIIIHMPERGFREWNLDAIDKMLGKLKQKGYEIGTLSTLFEKEKTYLRAQLNHQTGNTGKIVAVGALSLAAAFTLGMGLLRH